MVFGLTYGREGGLASTLARGKFFALLAGFSQEAELEGVPQKDFCSFAGMVLGLERDMIANAALRDGVSKSKAAVATGDATLKQRLTARLVGKQKRYEGAP